MSGLKRAGAAIVGAAESDLGQVAEGLNPIDLMAQGIVRALDDCGLALKEVDGLFCATTQSRTSGLAVALADGRVLFAGSPNAAIILVGIWHSSAAGRRATSTGCRVSSTNWRRARSMSSLHSAILRRWLANRRRHSR